MGSVPFTVDQFFGVFARYNEAVWPAQLVLIAAAVSVTAIALSRSAGRDRWVSGFLALLWTWTGIAYHLVHFSEINPAARAFGAFFVLQAALFLWWGVVRGRLAFGRPTFGAPCPTVIYTFGMLLLAENVPLWLLVVPVLWALLGSTAVVAFGVYQDLGLIVSALLALALIVRDRRPGAGRAAVPHPAHRA